MNVGVVLPLKGQKIKIRIKIMRKHTSKIIGIDLGIQQPAAVLKNRKQNHRKPRNPSVVRARTSLRAKRQGYKPDSYSIKSKMGT